MKFFLGNRTYFVFAACIGAALYFSFIAAPFQYPKDTVVMIPEGSTVREAAEILKERGVIKSVSAFVAVSRLPFFGGAHAGAYYLERPENVFTLAWRVSLGDSGLARSKVTIPEGITVREIGDILESGIPGFDKETFLTKAGGYEGYLFPDTYFFLPGESPESVIRTMRDAFDRKVAPFAEKISASGRSLSDIVIMASILEEEARLPETRRMVAGILWKRISIGMALQVDAAFAYIHQTPGYAPTGDDLDIDSPYNTYKNRGLPPTAISNPGIGAIEAALEPAASPYLFYLTGADGNMYYAKTLQEHIANRKHLK
jgi:UPF0755 protein